MNKGPMNGGPKGAMTGGRKIDGGLSCLSLRF